MREDADGAEEFHRAGLGAAHGAFLRRHEIVESRKVQPAVNKVKGELGAETRVQR